MFFSKATIIGLIQILPFVHAKNIQVLVGQNNTITFSPNTVRAVIGDTVEFVFLGGNHTVTSGTPLLGCEPDGRINSGFVFVSAPPAQPAPPAAPPANLTAPAPASGRLRPLSIFGRQAAAAPAPPPSFKITVLDFLPKTLYCAQKIHCQAGMVMVINPTTAGRTSLAGYTRLAAQAQANVAPPLVVGGVLRNAQDVSVAGWQVTKKNVQ